MSTRLVRGAAIVGSASILIALATTSAQAHAHLLSSDPAANASVSAPSIIVLHFSEALETKLSSFKLTNSAGAKVKLLSTPAPDAKSIAAKPAIPLMPGLYTVSWKSVGDDAHPMKGTYVFTVK